jgi:hypothetical protein
MIQVSHHWMISLAFSGFSGKVGAERGRIKASAKFPNRVETIPFPPSGRFQWASLRREG